MSRPDIFSKIMQVCMAEHDAIHGEKRKLEPSLPGEASVFEPEDNSAIEARKENLRPMIEGKTHIIRSIEDKISSENDGIFPDRLRLLQSQLEGIMSSFVISTDQGGGGVDLLPKVMTVFSEAENEGESQLLSVMVERKILTEDLRLLKAKECLLPIEEVKKEVGELNGLKAAFGDYVPYMPQDNFGKLEAFAIAEVARIEERNSVFNALGQALGIAPSGHVVGAAGASAVSASHSRAFVHGATV